MAGLNCRSLPALEEVCVHKMTLTYTFPDIADDSCRARFCSETVRASDVAMSIRHTFKCCDDGYGVDLWATSYEVEDISLLREQQRLMCQYNQTHQSTQEVERMLFSVLRPVDGLKDLDGDEDCEETKWETEWPQAAPLFQQDLMS